MNQTTQNSSYPGNEARRFLRTQSNIARRGSRQSKPAERGFTLIELLVVIAIIAILAAILFPVFAQARDKARQSAYLSNCKQIGIALQQYIQDYDETMPHASNITGLNTYPDLKANGKTVSFSLHWQQQLYPYIKNWQIFLCPSDSEPILPHPDPSYGGAHPATLSSYAINMLLLQTDMTADTPGSLPLSRLVSPASTYIVADATRDIQFFGYAGSCGAIGISRLNKVRFAASHEDGDVSPCFGGTPNPALFAGREDSRTRHQGGSTIVFADGHAKWNRWQNIKDEYSCPNPEKSAAQPVTGFCKK